MSDLAQLAEAYRALAQATAQAAQLGDGAALAELERVLAEHDRVKAQLEAVRTQLMRAHRAATETERLLRLRDAAIPDAADLALALLRGDWVTARDGLRRIAAHGEGKLAELALIIAAAVQALVDGVPGTLKLVEDAVRRIDRASRPAEAEAIRGALLVWLGRLYRDQLASAHLAAAAFSDARDALPDQPEPIAELAELSRRARQLEAAQRGFKQALDIADHRAGAYLGLAALHEDAGAWIEAGKQISKAVHIVAQELDPVDALERVSPTPLGSAFLRLGELLKHRNAELAIRALDRALALRVAGPKQPLAEVYRERGRLLTPPSADDLYAAGQRFLWRGDLVDAQACLEEALAVRADHADALLLLSDTWRMRAYEAGAPSVAYLEKALALSARGLALVGDRIDPPWVLSARGYILNQLAGAGDPRLWQAAELAEHALILEPAGSFHLTAASRFHRRLGHVATANALLAAARAIAPNDANVLEDSVRLFANTSEFDAALALIPLLPDTAWRRGVDAFIRMRMRRSRADLELARSYLESALQTPDPNGACWMNVALGMCLYHLGQPDAAHTAFVLARAAAASPAERAETALWTGDLQATLAIAEAGRKTSPEEIVDLTTMLAIAQLGTGAINEARATFAELSALVAGRAAANTRTYFADDLPMLAVFANATPEQEAVRAEFVAELGRRAEQTAAPELPRAELARATRTPAARRALTLAEARLALADDDDGHAYALYASLGDDQAARAGLARVAGVLAARAALAGRAEYLAEGRGFIAPHLTTAAQAAVALEHGDDPAVLDWLAGHLGAIAKPRKPPPALVLTLPAALGPKRPDGGWSFLGETLPEVRRLLLARYGAHMPWILVKIDPESATTCRLLLGSAEIAAIEVAATPGVELPIEQAAARMLVGDAHGLAPYTQLGGWLVHIVGRQLANLIGVQDVVVAVDTWAPPGGEPVIRRTGHLVRLTRLIRALLGEQIAIAPWQSVTDATKRWRKRSLEGLIAHARLQLRSALAAALERAPGPRLWVPWDVEHRVAAEVRHDGATEYFAAPPAVVEELLDQLRPLFAHAPPATLVVRGREARSWVRRLVALEAPDLLVVAQEELQVAGIELASVKSLDEVPA